MVTTCLCSLRTAYSTQWQPESPMEALVYFQARSSRTNMGTAQLICGLRGSGWLQ